MQKRFILDTAYKHREGSSIIAGQQYSDFSTAFSTIQHHIRSNKLLTRFLLDQQLTMWLMDSSQTDHKECWPTTHSQTSFHWRSASLCFPPATALHPLYKRRQENNQLPSGEVLPVTCCSSPCCQGPHLIAGLPSMNFVEWWDRSCLDMNVRKSKDMVVSVS